MVMFLIVRPVSSTGSLLTTGMTTLSVGFGTKPRSQLVATPQLVEVVPVQVSVAAENIQLVLLLELNEVTAVMAVALMLLLSFTSTKTTDRVPWGSIRHCVPVIEERSARRLPAVPWSVKAPVTVCVAPAAKVSVTGAETVLLQLLKV